VFLSLKLIVCKRLDSVHRSDEFVRLTGMKCLVLVVVLAACAWAQSDQPKDDSKHERGPGKEIGSGAGNIGTGAAKGAGNLAKGTGKDAVDLVTLHPINAATSVGKGAALAGKDVTVGTVKGTGKIGKGIGKTFKKLF
jgi:hypothetical protein